MTPLMLAASSGDPHLVNTLIEFDARVEDADKDGNTAIFYAKNKKKVQAFAGVHLFILSVNSISDFRYP